MKPQDNVKIWFATNAWERDYKVTLHPRRVDMTRRALEDAGKGHFAGRLLVLNNFAGERALKKAKRKADGFVGAGVFDDWIHAPEYLKDRLNEFNFDETRFWSRNPGFYTSHLAALLYLRGRADFMLFINGDTCLSERPPAGWLDDFFEKYQKAGVAGCNICHRGWKKGPYWTSLFRETGDFWITDHRPGLHEPTVTLNDCAFFLPTSPPVPYDFHLSEEEIREYSRIWPARAVPCFEMSYANWLNVNSLAFGLLKPINGMPSVKHKNVKGFFRRICRQRILGRYYANGKYGTKIDE